MIALPALLLLALLLVRRTRERTRRRHGRPPTKARWV